MQRAINMDSCVADTDVDSIFSVGQIIKSGIGEVFQLVHIQIEPKSHVGQFFWCKTVPTPNEFNGFSLLYVLVY